MQSCHIFGYCSGQTGLGSSAVKYRDHFFCILGISRTVKSEAWLYSTEPVLRVVNGLASKDGGSEYKPHFHIIELFIEQWSPLLSTKTIISYYCKLILAAHSQPKFLLSSPLQLIHGLLDLL